MPLAAREVSRINKAKTITIPRGRFMGCCAECPFAIIDHQDSDGRVYCCKWNDYLYKPTERNSCFVHHDVTVGYKMK